jgi:hypothetical protein
MFSLAASFAFPALTAQPADETLAQPPQDIEEILVRGGKTLRQYRLELERAREELVNLFNEVNEGNDTDLRCRDEIPTGSRIPRRVCRTHAEDRADARSALNFLNSLLLSSGPGSGDAEATLGEALSDAVRQGSTALAQFEAEWQRVLGSDRQFYEAVTAYAELEEELDRARGATSASTPQPRLIELGPGGPQCEASTLTEFEQRGNIARVSGTVSISSCPAGTTGSFTLVTQVRDDAGKTTSLEFAEQWQRADALDHVFSSDYPIGDDVELTNVRVRGLKCTCASAAK